MCPFLINAFASLQILSRLLREINLSLTDNRYHEYYIPFVSHLINDIISLLTSYNSLDLIKLMNVAYCLKITHNVSFEFWHFPSTFVHSQCKRSSLRSQSYKIRLFL